MTSSQWEQKVLELRQQGKGYISIAQITNSMFHPELSKEAEVSRVKRLVRRIERNKNTPTIDSNIDVTNANRVEYKSDGSLAFERIIAINDGEIITPEIVMKAHNLDPNCWTVVTFKNNFWQTQGKENTKVVLYQSKIVVKPKSIGDISIDTLHKHFETFKPSRLNTTTKINKTTKATKTMYELNICDLHLGKLSWNGETRENYDYKIASERFNKIIENNIKRIKEERPEKILFVWCNDFFNADGMNETTTGGTPQSCDLRWNKLFMTGCDLLVNALETLKEVAPYSQIESFYIASNHARQVEFYALCYLYAWFRNDKNVTVHRNCTSRYYVQYGINMIGFSHSYYEKKTNLVGLMSVEQPEMWSTTKYREFHLGHYHCEITDEKSGVVLRWLPSMTGTDTYHYDSGYLGAIRRSYSFVWDKQLGLKDIVVTSTFL